MKKLLNFVSHPAFVIAVFSVFGLWLVTQALLSTVPTAVQVTPLNTGESWWAPWTWGTQAEHNAMASYASQAASMGTANAVKLTTGLSYGIIAMLSVPLVGAIWVHVNRQNKAMEALPGQLGKILGGEHVRKLVEEEVERVAYGPSNTSSIQFDEAAQAQIRANLAAERAAARAQRGVPAGTGPSMAAEAAAAEEVMTPA